MIVSNRGRVGNDIDHAAVLVAHSRYRRSTGACVHGRSTTAYPCSSKMGARHRRQQVSLLRDYRAVGACRARTFFPSTEVPVAVHGPRVPQHEGRQTVPAPRARVDQHGLRGQPFVVSTDVPVHASRSLRFLQRGLVRPWHDHEASSTTLVVVPVRVARALFFGCCGNKEQQYCGCSA